MQGSRRDEQDLFLDCLTEPNKKLVEFAVRGISNCCPDPANAAVITSGVQWSQEEEPSSFNEEPSQNDDEDLPDSDTFSGTALYDFVAGGDDEISITAGEDLEIEYEVGGWYFVKKLDQMASCLDLFQFHTSVQFRS
ncbi:hypothetical protein R1flu_000739 [Riccia fluitans]|uniref:SH3 domain-containing protein n=1 Tax=Riccia fluitans TaxID=41844 RepID=A0ABD1Y1A7_9MARC